MINNKNKISDGNIILGIIINAFIIMIDLRSSPSPSTPWPEVAQGKWSSGQGGALGGRYRVHPGLEVGASLATSI